MEFPELHWPHLELRDDHVSYSSSTMRRVEETERIWDFFDSMHNRIDTIPGLDDIIAFMYYRVATVIPGDPYASCLRLQTSTGTELNWVIYLLACQHRSDF